MIIKSLFIEKYKKFNNKEIVFGNDPICNLEKEIFDKIVTHYSTLEPA